MDACIPVINLIDTRRSIPHGIQQVQELLGISCSFDQVVQCLSRTMKTVAKGILKDHLILVANSMTCTGNLNGFHKGGYNATLRSLKVQAPFTESTFTPVKCLEKAAEKCHTDSLGCVVSSCSWGKNAALGTGSSFQILWNENQVRTDQEKDAYTFLDDVDYLVEDNTMDDICLSPEWDGTHGMPTFEDNPEQQITEEGNSWENDTTANASWEQNAIAGNDSGNAQNVDAQDDPLGSVAAKAQNSTAQHMDGTNDSWGCVAAKTCTAGNDSWGSVAAKAQTSTAQQESWGNVAASPSDNAWGAAPISQGHENSDSKQPASWDGWSSAQADDSSADNWKTGNNKGWKSDGWDAKENRRDQRDNPGRSPMRHVERPPRPWYELPAEAKKVLQEIEPIVTMVRKIFRESCDGVRLPLEDEKFIIEKVLEHHPEKEKKVNKHHIFLQSRCFYVVSSDGTHTDFSYNKCMENYVRKNCAEHAELICGMHFKKCNRDRPSAVDGGAAPAIEAKASQSTNPGEDTVPGPSAGTPASLSVTTQQEETPASPAATLEDEKTH
nr:DNA-directed RNA polymerase V subunit 1-like [Aegilops tauschii subsp. strangulata]